MPTVLVTGSNRGIGLEFCRQYAEAGWKVLACCRRPEQASNLRGLATEWPSVSIHQLEVENFDQIDALAHALASEPIDVLINNAGVYGGSSQNILGTLDYDLWARVLKINTQAPVKMTEAFLPHVLRSQRKLVLAITSLMGSMGDNSSGGAILYRTSKAALNAAMKSIAIDLKPRGIGVLILHPGWVKTDMGGSNAPTSPAESVAGLRRVIEDFKPGDSGRFLDFRGRELPW
ncbi:SDR family oxidoreductase [Methylocaldum szegediense]|uniref:NAD(P)-dependent dehydrogenase (Short-subunit alcohol dehydrogenase family) n=1 Tax=Methylocaldum szegediense TaxID=73780 RepID=A0ABN8X2Q9_9GAMM|nr:SDR family oxidoreductase [Methylocaldum szegediense]CAI8839472.1 NAD(P)-dependent dehydrogenase (Short-subunit alcohol dehydrogenase family) [Methylocaldum szegediense]